MDRQKEEERNGSWCLREGGLLPGQWRAILAGVPGQQRSKSWGGKVGAAGPAVRRHMLPGVRGQINVGVRRARGCSDKHLPAERQSD